MNLRAEFIDKPTSRSEEGVSLDVFFAELFAKSDERRGAKKRGITTKRKAAADKDVR